MIFDDHEKPTNSVSLTPLRTTDTACECLLTVTQNGIIIESYKGTEPLQNLEALAVWIETLWNEVPDIVLESIPLRLSFGHREHIGEVFYDVIVNNKARLYLYEQTNVSNTARAQGLRDEIALLLEA